MPHDEKNTTTTSARAHKLAANLRDLAAVAAELQPRDPVLAALLFHVAEATRTDNVRTLRKMLNAAQPNTRRGRPMTGETHRVRYLLLFATTSIDGPEMFSSVAAQTFHVSRDNVRTATADLRAPVDMVRAVLKLAGHPARRCDDLVRQAGVRGERSAKKRARVR